MIHTIIIYNTLKLTMNIHKYREIYLNDFTMQKVRTPEPRIYYNWCSVTSVEEMRPGNHPWVNERNAFWIGGQELCVGWILKHNPNIYRPIFSYKRNDLINKINRDIVLGTSVNKIWKKAKSRYFIQLCLIKKIPIFVVMQIVDFTY